MSSTLGFEWNTLLSDIHRIYQILEEKNINPQMPYL